MTDQTADGDSTTAPGAADGLDYDVSLERPISVTGTEPVELSPSTLEALPRRERRVEIACLSGDRACHSWCGVGVDDLLERAPIPDETTHLLVESTDGYRICVDVETALGGVLAFVRDGEPLSSVADHETRFVAAGVRGPRTVKDVVRLEALALSPGDDPESYEDLLLGD